MEKCVLCEFDIRDCFCDFVEAARLAANDNNPTNGFSLLSDETIILPPIVTRMAISMTSLMYEPRRKILDTFVEIIWNYDGVIKDANGTIIDHINIDLDKVFRTDEDPEVSWLESFFGFAEVMPKQNAQKRTIERLHVLYMVLGIRYPILLKSIR